MTRLLDAAAGRTTSPADGDGATGLLVAARAIAVAAAVGLAYLALVVAAVRTGDVLVYDWTRVLYPGVWFAVSAGVLAWIGRAGRSLSWRARLVGVGYVLLLAAISGLVRFVPGTTEFGLQSSLPGWGPVAIAHWELIGVTIVPFQAAGFVVLGYLMARAIEGTRWSLSLGLVGLFSCAGCLVPIWMLLVGGIGGFSTAATSLSYGVSTIAFALAAIVLAGVVGYVERRGAACSVG